MYLKLYGTEKNIEKQAIQHFDLSKTIFLGDKYMPYTMMCAVLNYFI